MMRRLPIMSAVGLAALADAPNVRAEVTASQRHEENLMRCRVLAQIFRLPTAEIQRQAAELDWDMRALQDQLSGPRTIHIEVGPNETAAQVAARRPDVFLAQEQPDGSVAFSVRGQAVEITLQRALYPHAPIYSEPVPMSAHMAESAAILRRAERRTLHA